MGGVNYGVPYASLALRQATAYLTDRNSYVTHCGSVTNIAVYTLVGANTLHTSPWGKYTDWTITPGGGTTYSWAVTYNPTAANATLDASGQFPWVGGVREYEPSGLNNTDGKAISFTLVEYSRTDDPCRSYAGDQIAAALRSVGIQVNEVGTDIAGAHTHVMGNKEFDLYTGGWSLDPVPDYLILWDWAFYWHPGRPYNYGGINDPISNAAAEAAYAANTQADAVAASIAFQEEIAKMAWIIPLWIASGNKAVSRTYTGGNNGVPVGDAEDIYRGLYWTGFIDEAGFGTDNYFTFLDMHPTGYDWGNGAMTIRYGFKTATLQELNPVYTEFLWDQNVIGLVGYDSLVTRDPLNLATFAPWAASAYTVGVYNNPALGPCTKVVYTLRDDAYWQDGLPVTIADAYFTFIELPQDLAARGLAPPWWISNVLDVLSFSVLDAQSFEILYDAKAIYAIGWAGGAEILPEHIWKPIVTSLDPTVTMPDPNLIGSGAWRLAEYVANSHVLLVANTPQSVNFCQAVPSGNQVGDYPASPVNSTEGYFRLLPVSTDLEVAGPPTALQANTIMYLASQPYGGYWNGMRKLDPEDYPTEYTLVDTITNWFADRPINVTASLTVNGTAVSIASPTITVANSPGLYPTYPGTGTGIGFEGVFEEIGPGGGDWFYDGSALHYEKMLFVEPELLGNHGNTIPNMNITWNGNVVYTLSGGVAYYINWLYNVTFAGSTTMHLHIPNLVAFHTDLDWWLTTLWADIGGQFLTPAETNSLKLIPDLFPGTSVELSTQQTPSILPSPPYPNPTTIHASIVTRCDSTPDLIVVLFSAVYQNEQPVPDGKVDGRDITIAAKAFGTKPGDARWNTVADVNHDYKIDGRDITIIAKNFGWPPYTRSGYWIH